MAHIQTQQQSGGQPPSSTCRIDHLRQDASLWYRLHVFMFDLRHLRSNKNSVSRLECVVDPYYIGLPYFSPVEAERVRTVVIDDKLGRTLVDVLDDFFSQRLEKRLKQRMAETGDYRVCAAHDLAPIVEKAFGVNAKDLAKQKAFLAILKKEGVSDQAGRTWKGIGKKR